MQIPVKLSHIAHTSACFVLALLTAYWYDEIKFHISDQLYQDLHSRVYGIVYIGPQYKVNIQNLKINWSCILFTHLFKKNHTQEYVFEFQNKACQKKYTMGVNMNKHFQQKKPR